MGGCARVLVPENASRIRPKPAVGSGLAPGGSPEAATALFQVPVWPEERLKSVQKIPPPTPPVRAPGGRAPATPASSRYLSAVDGSRASVTSVTFSPPLRRRSSVKPPPNSDGSNRQSPLSVAAQKRRASTGSTTSRL